MGVLLDFSVSQVPLGLIGIENWVGLSLETRLYIMTIKSMICSLKGHIKNTSSLRMLKAKELEDSLRI